MRSSGDRDNTREIELVCPEELTAAITTILRQDYTLSREDLIGATARLLGYSRTARIVADRLASQILALEGEGILVANGEQVRLA